MKVEVGSRTRLQLAMALHAKGFFSLGEIDELKASFGHAMQDDDNDDDADSFANKKRKYTSASDRVEGALTRLPVEAASGKTADLAVRHARSALISYCDAIAECQQKAHTNEKEKCRKENQKASDIDGERLSPENIADMALAAFTGCVLAHGIEAPEGRVATTEAQHSSNDIEHALVQLLFTKGSGSKISLITEAVNSRLSANLSAAVLNSLQDVHILSISRMLVQMDSNICDDFLAESLLSCINAAPGVGFGPLSKIIPLVVCCKSSLVTTRANRKDLEDALGQLRERIQSNIIARIESSNSSSRSSIMIEKARAFIDIIFRGAQYCLFN